jgi:hypothetical protein
MHSPTFIRRNPFSFILMAFLLFFLSFGSGMLRVPYAYLGMYTNPYFEMPDNVAYSYTSIEAAEGAVAAAKPGCAGYACENITAVEGVMSRAFLCTKEVATYGTLGKKGLLENGLNFLYFIPAKGTQFTPGKFYYAGKGTETLSTLAQIDYQGASYSTGGEIKLVYPRSFPYYVDNDDPIVFFVSDEINLYKATGAFFVFCDLDQLEHPELLSQNIRAYSGSLWKQAGESGNELGFSKNYQRVGMIPLSAVLLALGALEYYFFSQNEHDYSLRVTLGQPWPITLLSLFYEQTAISVPVTALGIGLTYWLVPLFFQIQMSMTFLWFYGGATLIYLVVLTALFFIKTRSRSSFLKERKSAQ